MTHQKSLFNPKLAFEDIKQSKHVIILYTVALLLCTLLPAALNFSNYHDEETYFYLNSCAEFLSLANPFVMIFTFAMAFIFVILQFNYLYKPSSVIFVHSMPYTRANIIVTKYISGILSLLLPLIWVALINMLASKIMGVDYLISYTTLAKTAAYCILSVMFCYSVMVLAQTVSSGIFALLIAASFIFLIYPITKMVLAGLVTTYLKTYDIETIFSSEIDYIFPFWKIAQIDTAESGLTIGFSVYLIVLSIAMLVISAFIYTKRKSENSNKFFAFNIVNKFLKYYITIVLSLGVGALTASAADGSFAIAYIMYIVSAIIIFAVLQAIFDKNIKNMFANKLCLGAVLVVVSAVVFAFNFDVLKLNDKVPDARETKNITLRIPMNFGTDYYSTSNFTFENKEIIEKSILLMKKGESAKNRGWTSDDGWRDITFITDQYKKLGISRRVLLNKDECKEFLRFIYGTEEFKQQFLPSSDNFKNITYAYIEGYGENNEHFEIYKKSIEKLVTAYSNDIKNITADEFVDGKAIFNFEIEVPVNPKSDFDVTRYDYKRFPVFESCTKTIEAADEIYKNWYQTEVEQAQNTADKAA